MTTNSREPLEQAVAGAVPPMRSVGDYCIVREIGRGGMGTVYEAEQQSLGRRVALKILPANTAHEAKALERFRREARAAARLHHTNIVPIFEVGQEGEVCWYAMQLIQGQSLDQIVQELRQLRSLSQAGKGRHYPVDPRDKQTIVARPALSQVTQSLLTGEFVPQRLSGSTATQMSAPSSTTSVVLPGQAEFAREKANHHHYFHSVARIGQQTATALAYAHARGIVHRDIKPSNLMLDGSGVVWVTDFGLAKTEDDGLTKTGEIPGTFRYMAPERFQGECDVRADVYALGLTLYEMLVLKPAFGSRDRLELIVQIHEVEPARPRLIEPQVPRDLETIVLKAIEKDPHRRYQSADAMAEDLRRFLGGEPILARRVRLPERLTRWCQRNPLVATLTAVVFVLLVVVALVASVGLVQTTLALNREADQRQRAEHESEAARSAEARAQKEAAWSRRMSYDADMQLAAQLWQSPSGSARAVLDLLEAHRPGAGQEDLRDFAWHFQWRLCHDPLTLADHQGTPLVALASGGNLITFDEARVLRRWDRATGTVVGSWQVPGMDGVGARFDLSADGALLAMGTSKGKVSLYDTATGQERLLLEEGPAVSGLSFAPDGGTLAIVYAGRKARVWDVRAGKPLTTIDLTGDLFSRCVLGSRGGTVLLSGQPNSHQVSLYRAGKEGPLVRGLSSSIGCVACSPDGRWFVMGDAIEVKICETTTGKLAVTLPTQAGGVYAMAFSPDGTRLSMGGFEGLVTVWDLTTRRLLFQLKGHIAQVSHLRFAADGKALVSSAADGTAKLWEFTHLEESRSLVPASGVSVPGLVYSPDGRWLAVAGRPARLFDAHTGKLKRPFDPAVRVAFSPDSKTLALGDWDGRIHLCDVDSGQVLRSLEGRPGEPIKSRKVVGSLAFSPNGKLLAAGFGDPQWWETVEYEQIARVWDVATGRTVQTLPHNKTVPALSFSSDSTLLATASHEGVARLWPVGRWQEVQILREVGAKALDAIAMAPGGDLLATGSLDSAIRLWDTRSGRLVATLRGHSYHVFSLTFSPDGKTLASASWDRTVKLWDVVSGRELRTFIGHTNWIHCVAFSPDGRMLASCDQSGGVRLWDTLSRWQRTARANNLAAGERP